MTSPVSQRLTLLPSILNKWLLRHLIILPAHRVLLFPIKTSKTSCLLTTLSFLLYCRKILYFFMLTWSGLPKSEKYSPVYTIHCPHLRFLTSSQAGALRPQLWRSVSSLSTLLCSVASCALPGFPKVSYPLCSVAPFKTEGYSFWVFTEGLFLESHEVILLHLPRSGSLCEQSSD